MKAPQTTMTSDSRAGEAAQERHIRRSNALLELLDDDNPQVVESVKAEFEKMGRAAGRVLRRGLREGSVRQRSRARQLLLEGARKASVRRLVRYAARSEHDLERALILLDQHGSPGTDLRPYKKVLDVFGGQLMSRLLSLPPGPDRVHALTEYLAEEIGFSGSTDDFHHTDNIYLHRAIERREGMPLTLSAIYCLTARRAGLQAGLLHFPGHVLLSVTEGGQRYLVDPFGGGQVLSREQCDQYLLSHQIAPRERYYEDASDSIMFARHVNNLILSCRMRKRGREVRNLRLVQHVLAKNVSITQGWNV